MYNMGAYIRARRALRALLTDHPDFRQAAALAQECDDLVLRDGLVGVGVLGGVLGVGLGLLVGASRRR
jgi:fission 1 protein